MKLKKVVKNLGKIKLDETYLGVGAPQTFGLMGLRKESIFEKEPDKPKAITEEQKMEFLEAVKNFNSFNESVYRKNELKNICEKIMKIGELAENILLQEESDWFDGMSVKRDMKGLKDSVKLFEQTAKEITVLQQRMESVYEEIGGKLNKYFEIDDKIISEILRKAKENQKK